MVPDTAAVSIIVPVLNEATILDKLISSLRSSGAHEIIIVDGGSSDTTGNFLQQFTGQGNILSVSSRAGRARQMNTGALGASGDILLFLHADTRLPEHYPRLLTPLLDGGFDWGRFDIRFDDDHPMMPVVSWLMNTRSRLTGIATGDQAIFVRTKVFHDLQGFADIPLMEDIELSRRLRKIGRPLCIKQRAMTSARRWRANGIVRTILLMWGLRLGFWLGLSPDRLQSWYSHSRE